MATHSIWTIIASINNELALFAATAFLIGGIDDLAVDLVWLWSRIRSRLRTEKASDQIAVGAPEPSGPLAIFVPAWDEADVIGHMIRTTITRFGEASYRLYVGCYPNDPRTIEVVQPLLERHERLRLVLTDSIGPTTKADNLNALWAAMTSDERAENIRFQAVILHDAEDFVHPAELRLFGSLLGEHALIQIPVEPIITRTSRWTAGHYGDEFAEAHGKTLVVRTLLGAGLPSAGVGCAISRDMLGDIADERGGRAFDETSLTEDYELGLRVAERGGRAAFVRAIDPADGSAIVVRAYFPQDIGAAIRQKSRWVKGIALMGWERLGWRGGWAERWMRARDRLAPLSALVLASAYLSLILSSSLLIAGAASIVVPGPAALPMPLLIVVGALLVWRLAMRGYFTARIYG